MIQRSANGVETVVFDLGGVLIDWEPRYLYRKVFDDETEMEWFLSEICNGEWNRRQDLGRPFDEAVSKLAREYPDLETEIRAYDERWEEMVGGLLEDSVSVLEELHEAGYALHALTNFSDEKFRVARDMYGFFELFDEIIVSGREGAVKPDTRIYRILIERTGLLPKRSAFVDDREENVRAAESLGFHGIVFDGGENLRRELRILSHRSQP